MTLKSDSISWHNKRVKTPTILQMEMTECGAVSLSIILAYYKLFIPLEKLRLVCGVSRDGSNAQNIVKAARSFGLDARGFNVEPENLNTLKLPLIIHWEFNHFVVLEGRKGDIFYINDPAGGRRKVLLKEFDNAFTGLAIQLFPTKDFKCGGAPDSLLMALLSRLKNVKSAVFFITLCSMLLAVPGIIIPTMSRIFVDDVLGQNPDWLLSLIIVLVVTSIVKTYLIWLQRTAVIKLSIRFIVSTTTTLFNHLIRMPTEFYCQRSAGELQYRMSLNRNLSDVISGQIGEFISGCFMVVFYIIVMLQYDVPLAVTGIFIACLNIAIFRIINQSKKIASQSVIQEKGKLMGVTAGGIRLMETIKATASDFDFFSKWAGHQAKVINEGQKICESTIYLSAIPKFLSGLNNVVILIFGAWRVIHGDMSMGMLVAFQSLMVGFLTPITTLTEFGAQIQETKESVDKINDILRYPKDSIFDENTGDKELEENEKLFLEGELELKNITFGYAPLLDPIIKNFSLHLMPGRRVAVIGRSGSGKSTIAKIAAGLYKPWSGEVLLDGRPYQEYSRQCLENSFAIVDQDIAMFSGTVRDNLTMWNPLKGDDVIIKAAVDACIHSDITSRSGGYGTELIEDGRNFSGGQRQRLEIARALSNNPSILILDEATSALDPETEKVIDENLRRRGCSCLIIAHRLSTIRDCDEIIVMEKGEIVQRGYHDQLIKDEKGYYFKLIQSE